MKKKALWVILAVVAAAQALGACASSATDAADAFTQSTYTADASQIQAIEVDVTDRIVRIEPATGEEISIIYAESSKDRYTIDEGGGAIRIGVVAGTRNWTDYLWNAKPAPADRTLLIQVPPNALDTLSVRTTNDLVAASDIEIAGSVDLDSSNGDLAVDGLAAGRSIRLAVKKGTIEGTLAGPESAYSITAEAIVGDSNLPESQQGGDIQLDVVADHGDISLQFADK